MSMSERRELRTARTEFAYTGFARESDGRKKRKHEGRHLDAIMSTPQ